MVRVAAILLLPLLTLQGYRSPDTAPTADPRAALYEASLRLYVFDCGRIRLADASIEMFGLTTAEVGVRELAVPCYVIEHELGRLIWDGGMPSALAELDGWENAEEELGGRLDRTFADQLADLGLDMSSFDYQAYSHMHYDHVGVANEVQGATLIIQQAEYKAAFADEITVPAFDPALYGELEHVKRITLEGDHDVFGDGRVRIISAPGHTPGHQVLFLDLENTGPIVLSGDLYHFRFSWKNRRVPSFNVDAEQTLESMERVDALLKETGAELWIEHELALFEKLNKAPKYYD